MAIKTLTQLQKEKEKIKMQMEVTKHEFAQNLGTNRKQLKDFFLKKVVLPVGAAGVAIAGINKLAGGDEEKPDATKSASSIFDKALPLLLNLAQAFIMKQIATTQEEVIEETEPNGVSTSQQMEAASL